MDAQAMTELYLSGLPSLTLQAGVWLSCGALIGTLHLLTLRWNVKLFIAGGAPLLAMALQLGRLAILTGVLAVIVSRFGALSLLVATAGILIARTAALRVGEQP
jgi:F1F0 ATPase subunit 2